MTNVGIMNSGWDTWISEEDLLSLNDEDRTWFKEELGLSSEDLYLIIARAKELARELKPSDILEMTYDTDGGWYIHGTRIYPDTDSRWKFSVYREDQTIIEQQTAQPEPF
jgi:hypothetical protein